MPEYEEHFVAFVDVLGFKDLIDKASCDEIHTIIDALRKGAHGEMILNDVEINAFKHLKYTIISDSIVIYIKSIIENAFASLINICNKLQVSLAKREDPILLRGGIAIGNLYAEDNIVYGEGLNKAYLLENNLAKYPRIVFTGDTLSASKENTKEMFVDMEGLVRPYQKDEDALYFIDYLKPMFFGCDDLIKYYDRLKETCDCLLSKNINSGVREKYLWLDKKIEKAIQANPSVAAYFKKRKEEYAAQHIEEYNKQFAMFPHQFEIECEITEI